MIKTTIVLLIGIAAAAANAQTVTGTPTNIQPGGGCFNVQVAGHQISLPYMGNNPAPPRGGADAINAWVNTFLTQETVTVTLGAPINTQICPLGGFSISNLSR